MMINERKSLSNIEIAKKRFYCRYLFKRMNPQRVKNRKEISFSGPILLRKTTTMMNYCSVNDWTEHLLPSSSRGRCRWNPAEVVTGNFCAGPPPTGADDQLVADPDPRVSSRVCCIRNYIVQDGHAKSFRECANRMTDGT